MNSRRRSPATRFETLESRRLLAVAAYQTELLADDGGVPGALIADNQVFAGDTFFVRITAQEFDPRYAGLRVATVDVAWDASLLDVVEEDFSPATSVTSNLPILQTGRLDQDAGTIRGLGGTLSMMSGRGTAIGNLDAETLAIVPMRAGENPGVANLSLEFSRSPTMLWSNWRLQRQHVRLDSEAITILPPVAASAIETTAIKTPTIATAAPESLAAAPIPSTDAAAMDAPPVMPGSVAAVATDPATIDPAFLEPEVPANDLLFDANEDGVFDFGDFGLLNGRMAAANDARSAVAPPPSAVDEAMTESVEDGAPSFASAAPAITSFQHVCVPMPEATDVAAREAWLDAFAAAWIADAPQREARRARFNPLF